MTKHTEQVEREVVETVTEQQEFWTCDDCKREFEEDELIPVGVGARNVGLSVEASGAKMRSDLRETARRERSSYGMSHGYNTPFGNSQAWDYIQELIPAWCDVEVEAATSLDVCPECLKDDFGVEIEEHDGVHYDERNVEVDKSLHGEGFDFDLFQLGMLAGAIPFIGLLVFTISLFERDWDVFLGTLLLQLVWVIILQAFVL